MTISFSQNPVKTRIELTPEHTCAALRWYDTMRDKEEWGLTVDQQVELLGGIKKNTFLDWKTKALNREPVKLGCNTMERLSLMLGIYKALSMIAPAGRQQLGKQWFSTCNTDLPFNGISPKEFLLNHGTIEALYAVRRYLDAARG